MSTSILYHAFGLKGIEYRATRFFADTMIFSAEMKKEAVRCPNCGSWRTIFKGQKRRWFQVIFHVISLMNQAIDELRLDHQAELDSVGQQTLKGSRFLLLRNYGSLEPDRKARLDALFSVNRPLFEIHSMKEQLRLFWEKADRKEAEQFLAVWCRDAMNSGIKVLKKVGKTLAAYRTGLLNFFDRRITSGAVEGLINKIRTLKRQAYGFRDADYFKLRLYHLHTQRYSLAG